jgi:hypothetical protein
MIISGIFLVFAEDMLFLSNYKFQMTVVIWNLKASAEFGIRG